VLRRKKEAFQKKLQFLEELLSTFSFKNSFVSISPTLHFIISGKITKKKEREKERERWI